MKLLQGESHTSNLFTLLLSCLVYFYFVLFVSFIKNPKKLVTCFFYLAILNPVKMSSAENTKLCDFTSTNNNDFICTPIAPPASPSAFYEIKPALLNLVMKEQFFGVSTDDAAVHLNNLVELCEMQKYKDMVRILLN